MHYLELSHLLATNYVKYGLTTEEFIMLNSCLMIMHSDGKITIEKLTELTKKSKEDIASCYESLVRRGKIKATASRGGVDLNELWKDLNQILESEKRMEKFESDIRRDENIKRAAKLLINRVSEQDIREVYDFDDMQMEKVFERIEQMKNEQ